MKYFLRLRSNGKEKRVIFLKLSLAAQYPSHTLNVHSAHDRKTSEYSALVTGCEENGFKTHMFALEVGCLGYCPHSFLHCFEALCLPKSAARQIRSEASKTALRSSYVLFFAEACRLGSVKLFFTEPRSRRSVFSLFFFVFICFAIFVSHRSHSETTRSVSKHTRNTPRFSLSPTVSRTPYSMRTPVFCALPSGINYRAASRLRPVSSSFYVDSMMRVRIVGWWISSSNLQLAALTL